MEIPLLQNPGSQVTTWAQHPAILQPRWDSRHKTKPFADKRVKTTIKAGALWSPCYAVEKTGREQEKLGWDTAPLHESPRGGGWGWTVHFRGTLKPQWETPSTFLLSLHLGMILDSASEEQVEIKLNASLQLEKSLKRSTRTLMWSTYY